MIQIQMPGIEEFTTDFFQQASDAWLANKIRKNDCTYVYKCVHQMCRKPVHKHLTVCVQHMRLIMNRRETETEKKQKIAAPKSRMITRSMRANL